MADSQRSKAKGVIGVVAAAAAAVGAFILTHASEEVGKMGGEYLGISLFFPLVVVFACCWIAGKVLPANLQDLSIVIGIIAGQIGLHLFGGLVIGPLTAVLFDIVILTIGLVWLIVQPGVWPIILLTAFEIFALGSNLLTLTQVTNFAPAFKGLISFMLIRLAAISFLITAYQSLKAKAKTVVAAAHPDANPSSLKH